MSIVLWMIAGWCGLNAVAQEIGALRIQGALPDSYRAMIPLYWCATILAIGFAEFAQ